MPSDDLLQPEVPPEPAGEGEVEEIEELRRDDRDERDGISAPEHFGLTPPG